jgi:hypothetical protein
MRVIEGMFRRIPTADRKIETTAIGDAVVHQHDFLVMRAPDRRAIIETEPNLGRFQIERKARKELAFERIDYRIIPEQKMNDEFRAACNERREKRRELDRQPIIRRSAFTHETRVAVQIPTDDEYRMPRRDHRFAQGPEERCGIDQNRRPVRTLYAPDIPARLQDCRRYGALV